MHRLWKFPQTTAEFKEIKILAGQSSRRVGFVNNEMTTVAVAVAVTYARTQKSKLTATFTFDKYSTNIIMSKCSQCTNRKFVSAF